MFFRRKRLLFLSTTDLSLGTFTCPGVRLGALSPHRQTAAMSQTSVATDVDEALDVHRHLTTQRTFHLEVGFYGGAQPGDVIIGQNFYSRIGIHTRNTQNLTGRGGPHAINVTKGGLNTFLPWKINTCNSCHASLTLLLLVSRILTDHAPDTVALYDLAVLTPLLNARSDFHSSPVTLLAGSHHL
jgi:hypothetical protein